MPATQPGPTPADPAKPSPAEADLRAEASALEATSAMETGSHRVTVRSLRWIFLALLVVLLAFLYYARHLLEPFQGSLQGRLVLDGVIVTAIVFFCGAAFTAMARMQESIERRNAELLALHRAALDIYGELSLNTVLQKVVDQARALLSAEYGAISIVNENGEIEEFRTSGISEAHRHRIGAPPVGKGLLGVSLHDGRPLRINEISADSRSVGFPENHPVMSSLLAVPIACKSPFRGNIYLTNKEDGEEFSVEDEGVLSRFAIKAAIAIDNAHLHQRLRSLAIAEERLMIAREMHDGMAQVLAYVNTKAQAVMEFLKQDRHEDAAAQLEQLAKAAREVSVDVREGILSLRTELKSGRSLDQAIEEFIKHWQDQSGIQVDFTVKGDIDLEPSAQLQLLRIVQEALANVRKHAGAQAARVELFQADGRLHALVEDDGTGFNPEEKHGKAEFPRFGLAIMHERAQSIGAELSLDSVPGGGTRIRVEVPVGIPS
jgi:signal transduction histidine kinase